MIILVLGGTRSGKSEVAEALVGPVAATYLATGVAGFGGDPDPDFAARIDRHRARRPAAWSTVEEPRAVPQILVRLYGPVLLDSLGTWVANELSVRGAPPDLSLGGAPPDLSLRGAPPHLSLRGAPPHPRVDVDGLVDALVHRPGDTVVVSEEVGLGVHPPTELGRRFADALGELNRRVAEVADRCLLVVAGRVVELPSGREVQRTEPPPLAPGAAGEPATPGAGFPSALALLTTFGRAGSPGPGAAPGPATAAWLPVVGALIGLALGLVWWPAEELLGPLAAAAVIVALDLAVTGALHFDGLVDSADGLLAHLAPGRRLEVMAAPDVGVFGLAAGGGALLLRFSALAALGTSRPLLLASLWTASRAVMTITLSTGVPARPGGFADALARRAGGRRRAVIVALPAIAGATLLAIFDDPLSPVAVAATLLAGAAVERLARRRLGGFTGDTLGASGVVAETAGLLVALAVAP